MNLNPSFEAPFFLALIPFCILAVNKLLRQRSFIGFSSTDLFDGLTVKLKLIHFERIALSVFFTASLLILAKPTESIKTLVPINAEARDITLVVDISGSMKYSDEKINVVREVIATFVATQSQDRLGLFVFNDESYLGWPLSLDHEPLLYYLDQSVIEGGTQISEGILAGLEHQQQFAEDPGAIIVVSDGASRLTDTQKEAIENSKAETKIYWIWIADSHDDPAARNFGDYMRSINGTVYEARTARLAEIFAEISKLESSPITWQNKTQSRSRYGFLPWLNLISFLFASLVHLIREV